MARTQSRKIDKCLNEIEACVNEGPIWDEAGWRAFIDDIDILIDKKRAEIAEFQRSRKVALENIERNKAFPWNKLEETNFRGAKVKVPT